MKQSFYIQKNGYENMVKFGKSGSNKNSLINRLYSSNEQHPEKTSFIIIYWLKTKQNIFPKELDLIISIYGRNDESIEKLEQFFNCKLPCLKKIKNYLINKGGSTEYISNDGIELLKKIIEEEFPLLNINSEKLKKEIIDDINKKVKKKKNEKKKKKKNDINNILKIIKKQKKKEKKQKKIIKKKEFKLKLPQKEIINSFNNNHGIVCLPPGVGKTICGLGIIKKYNKNGIIGWFTKFKSSCDSFEYNYDNKYKNWKILDEETIILFCQKQKIKIINIKKKIKECKKIYKKIILVCNEEKFKNLDEKYILIVHDELQDCSDIGLYPLLKKYKENGTILIGLSATPIKQEIINSRRNLFELYNNNYFGKELFDLFDAIDKGYLCPLHIKIINYNVNKNQESSLFNNDLEEKDILKIIKDNIYIIKDAWIKSNTKKILIWTKTKKWAELLQKELLNENLTENILSSNSENDLNSMKIMKFKKSNKGILITVNRFRQADDDQRIDTGIAFEFIKKRMTHRNIQMIGRIVRLHKDKNKGTFIQICINNNNSDFLEKIFSYLDEITENGTKFRTNINKDKLEIISNKTNKKNIIFDL